MDEKELLEALRANVVLLRQALMVGHPVPIVQRMYAAAQRPQPGDLVIETSLLYYPAEPKRFGTLLRIEREPVCDPSQWDEEAEGRPVPTERVFYIRGLDGQEHRWVNADFMRIARDEDDIREMRGESPRPGIYTQDERRRVRLEESRR